MVASDAKVGALTSKPIAVVACKVLIFTRIRYLYMVPWGVSVIMVTCEREVASTVLQASGKAACSCEQKSAEKRSDIFMILIDMVRCLCREIEVAVTFLRFKRFKRFSRRAELGLRIRT